MFLTVKNVMCSVGQMGGAPTKGARSGRDRSAEGHQNWKEAKESLEENGHKSLLCR